MSEIAYIWRPEAKISWYAVREPSIYSIRWRQWLRCIGASFRKVLFSGDWIFSDEAIGLVRNRINGYGWVIRNEKPDPGSRDMVELAEGRDPWRLKTEKDLWDERNPDKIPLTETRKDSSGDFFGGFKSEQSTVASTSPKRHYAKLYVLPTAPKEVVDAAFKALQRLYHPDFVKTSHKSSERLSQEVSEAHQAIYQERGW